MHEPDLFTLSRRTDPASSRAAAERHAASGRLDSDRARVLQAVRETPGLTSKQLAARHGLDRYMAARRLADLRHDGKVYSADDGGELRWWAH